MLFSSFLFVFQMFCNDVEPSEMFSCLKENKHKPEFDKRYSHNAPRQYDVRDARFSNSYVLGQAFVVSFIMFALRQQGVIGNGVISLL